MSRSYNEQVVKAILLNVASFNVRKLDCANRHTHMLYICHIFFVSVEDIRMKTFFPTYFSGKGKRLG